MSSYTQSLTNLMSQLSHLPGIGTRSAERIAFYLLKQKPEDAMKLADAIRDVKTRIRNCSICYNLTEQDPCDICKDDSREQSVVCVVEQPKDLLALETTGLYKGVYHVLLGRIAPLEDGGQREHPQDARHDQRSGHCQRLGRPRLTVGQVADQGRQLQADEAEDDAFQQEDHGLVDRVQLQPGLRGGNPLPAPADDQARDDHCRHRRDVQRRAQHVRGVWGDQRDHGLQYGIGDSPAQQDDPGREHESHPRAARCQDSELPGPVQQHTAGCGPESIVVTGT